MARWQGASARTRDLSRLHFGREEPGGGRCHNGGSSCNGNGFCNGPGGSTLDWPRPRPDRTAAR